MDWQDSKNTGSLEEVRPGRTLFTRKVVLTAEDLVTSTQENTIQLVCIHGTCATEQQYHLLIDSMKRKLSNFNIICIMYDFMGCNQSPCIPSWEAYENQESAADLQAIIDRHVDRSLPVVIMGHSYGPNIILHYLNSQQQASFDYNLKGLVLISTSVRNAHLHHADGGHVLMKLPVTFLNCLQSTMTNAFADMAVHPDHVALKETIRQSSNNNDMTVAKGYHRHMKWATELDLACAQQYPVLVIHGVDDQIIPVECAQHLSNAIHNSTLVLIEKASHLVMMEQPDQVAESVLSFLKTVIT